MRSLVLAAGLAAAGCGGPADGPRVTGTVTFKGSPVPSGRVLFDPAGAGNAAGQQGFAVIRDGRYDTADGGKPPSPGPVVVRVTGADASGRPLFAAHEFQAEVSGREVTKDVAVPASAADRLAGGGGP